MILRGAIREYDRAHGYEATNDDYNDNDLATFGFYFLYCYFGLLISAQRAGGPSHDNHTNRNTKTNMTITKIMHQHTSEYVTDDLDEYTTTSTNIRTFSLTLYLHLTNGTLDMKGGFYGWK